MEGKIVVLKKTREIPVKMRHPWIYSGAISRVSGNPYPGDVVLVMSYKKEPLGYGWYSPKSQIRVRMLSYDTEEKIDEEFFFKKMDSAYRYRKDVSPFLGSNAYRLVNSEGDGLPGLIVDYYNGYIVCQFLSAGSEKIKDLILQYLTENIKLCGIVERSDVGVRVKEGLNIVNNVLFGEIPDKIKIQEKDVSFLVDIKKGHKTGFYLDQRENRYFVGNISHNKKVLNCFSYTGGFGLHALIGGAKKVINIDRSEEALKILKDNLSINNISKDEFEIIRENVFSSLRSYMELGESFDMVILDPPKFVKQTSQLKDGIKGYKKLNKRALKIVKPGGYLITFSCSGLVDRDNFEKIIIDSAISSGRDVKVVKELSAGLDHPYPPYLKVGKYLKGLVIRVY
ncbi:class I SAM-dependent methyltransferase [Desulfothermus okinawensis JCM 13304]